jgi:hypothetical protein
MTRNKRTVEDLIDEMEEPASTAGPPPERKPQDGWIPAAALLALGIGIGWFASGLRPPNQGAAATKPGMETPENLVSAGWQESDQGVFTRRCQDNCRRPVLYGGGVADVMEVNCLERPCGVIQAVFAVVDERGQIVDQETKSGAGRQGERLQLVLESRHPKAQRFVLQSFSAKARVD